VISWSDESGVVVMTYGKQEMRQALVFRMVVQYKTPVS
jgi:hypothetical protein